MSPTSSARLLERNPFQRIKHIPGQSLSYLLNPKVATKSLELSLWRAHDPGGAPENPHVPFGPFIRHARDLSEQSFTSLRNSEFFSVVRNPYSRLLSGYLNKVKGAPWKKISVRLGLSSDSIPDIHKFLDAVANADPYDLDHHFRPQHLNILHEVVPLDFVGYFEDMESVGLFLNRHGFSFETNRRNSTNAETRIREFLDSRAIDVIQRVYEKDFEIYGYSRDPAQIAATRPVTSISKDRSHILSFLARRMASEDVSIDSRP